MVVLRVRVCYTTCWGNVIKLLLAYKKAQSYVDLFNGGSVLFPPLFEL